MNNLDVINLIRGNRVDILIDLMGITSRDTKIQVLKNRAAPIQIVWCGYCNTTGIEEVDYIISDPNLIYDSELNLYQEKIIFMPKIWNCHSGIDIKRTLMNHHF